MNIAEASHLGRESLWMVLLVGSPVLMTALLVGTLISVLQAATQIHEQSLASVAKLFSACVVLSVASGWMLEQLVTNAERSFARASEVAR